MPGRVQEVQPTNGGYGINIWDENGQPALTVIFPTESEAEKAHAEMKAIIDRADQVKRLGP
jgi:hypothetical protein